MIHSRERGAALLVSLVMLVVLTLFVISAISTSNVNLKIVGNMQAQKAMEATAQQAIEAAAVSNLANFFPTPSADQTVTVNGYSVSIKRPKCLRSAVPTGSSLTSALSPEETIWDVAATVTDSITNAQATIHQGVRVILPAGNCP